MLLPHAQTLVQARSYVGATADGALTIEASCAYERVLLELDRVHGDECPALDTEDLTDDRDILLATEGELLGASAELLRSAWTYSMIAGPHGRSCPRYPWRRGGPMVVKNAWKCQVSNSVS